MIAKMNRRELIRAGAAAGLAAAVPRGASEQAPAVIAPKGGVKPVVISSANGNKFKNGGDMTCVAEGVHDDDAGARTCSTP